MPQDYLISNCRLSLNVDWTQVRGIVEYTITPLVHLNQLKLNARVNINRIRIEQDLQYQLTLNQDSHYIYDLPKQRDHFRSLYDQQELLIQLDQPANQTFVLQIEYSCRESCSLIFRSTQCFLTAHMNQARFWMPCLDKPNEKFTVDIMVSVPMDQSLLGGSRHQMIAVCSGKLLSRLQQDKRFVYLFREDTPISTSSLVIAIGPWESIRLVQNKKLDNVDDQFTEKLGNQHSKIEIFYPLGYKKAVQATTFFLPQAMEFFEQWIGTSYPFDSFKIVFTEHLSGLSFIGSSCVVCGLDVLVQESTIDQVIETRSLLSQMLVRQWFGHYVSPTHWDDIWVIIGFVSVISQQFIRKLHGANEDKFRGRKDMERCVYLDVNQLPLCPSQMSSHLIENYPEHFPCYPEQDPQSPRSELLQLKAALVLQMMEKRMGKGLIQKICNRIIVQTMSGELLNGLSTLTFLKVARKISGKIEIKEFADQWIFGSGCPIFDVSYHFNRKKMVIELKIKQRSSNDGVEGCTHKFSGPFTIRVQEPAGQFDTEVKIEEYVQQYDIIYHTKYKRIRRQPKKKKKSDEQQEEEEEEEEEEVVAEQLQDGTVELKIAEPDRITFESIRLDPEGIWLCHKTFEQDDFMWLAILKKEKDVVAQLESVQGIARINTLASCHTLAALSKDPNLYYRLRIESIYSLMNFDTPELEYAGLTSLMKLLKDQFVMVSSVNLPKRNNFDNLIEYYILCALVDTITRFRSPEGHSQRMVRELLMDMLEYNDNTHNQFSDSYYVSLLIDSLSFSFMTRPRSYDDVWKIHETRQVPKERTRKLKKSDFEEIEFKTGSGFHQVDIPDEDIFKRCLKELERLLVQEYQVPSYRNTITVSCLTSYCFFQAHRMMKPNLELFLEYSRPGYFYHIRQTSIESLILISGLRFDTITKYLAQVCICDQELVVRQSTAKSILNYLLLVHQQMESGQLPDSQKQTFLRALELLCDPWLKQNLTTMHPNVYKYVYQVLKMAYDVLPSTEQHPRPKLKIRLPTLAAIPSIEEEKEPEPVPVVVVEKPQKPKQPTPKKKVKLEPEFERCRKALQKIMNLKSAFWFLQPVDHVGMGLVNYLDVIKEPMDLGTIMTQLEAGEIQSVQEFSRLVRLVFENAIKYNPELSQVTVDAKQLLFRFDSEFSSELATMDDETKEMCLDVLQKLFASEHSAIFRAPVDPQLYATYYKVIKDPMDLTTCKQRLESGQYPTLQHFHQDIRKIINNCYKFNKKGTYGYAAGRSFENYYNQIRKGDKDEPAPSTPATPASEPVKIKLKLKQEEKSEKKELPTIKLTLSPQKIQKPVEQSPEKMPKLSFKIKTKPIEVKSEHASPSGDSQKPLETIKAPEPKTVTPSALKEVPKTPSFSLKLKLKSPAKPETPVHPLAQSFSVSQDTPTPSAAPTQPSLSLKLNTPSAQPPMTEKVTPTTQTPAIEKQVTPQTEKQVTDQQATPMDVDTPTKKDKLPGIKLTFKLPKKPDQQ